MPELLILMLLTMILAPLSLTVSRRWAFTVGGGSTLSSIADVSTGDFQLAGFENLSVADSTTDERHVLAIDVSQVKTFWIVSDQDVTLETNDGTSPADTLALKAGIPYEWDATSNYHTFALSTDVTDFYFTNASGSAALISCGGSYDSTP